MWTLGALRGILLSVRLYELFSSQVFKSSHCKSYQWEAEKKKSPYEAHLHLVISLRWKLTDNHGNPHAFLIWSKSVSLIGSLIKF